MHYRTFFEQQYNLFLKLFSSFFLLFIFVSCSSQKGAQVADNQSDRGKRLVGEQAMVSSAHPLASEAGLKMLKEGGTAVDAAVATAFALNVVEPNMSGIGGGGSMVVWNQQNKKADYVDFYTAKRAESYKNVDYNQYDEDDFNLLSTGVPGTVDGLLQSLERHGTMSREEVMEPAISYARNGFPVYITLAQFIRAEKKKLNRYEGARETFYPDGQPLEVGDILKQPELAETLQQISNEGATAFYEGKNAKDIVEVLNEAGNPITTKDLSSYDPQWNKQPLKGSYKDYRVLSAPLPQTGLYIIQALNILESFNLKQTGLPTVSGEAFDILTATMRLANADRRKYVSDPNWEDVPVSELISKEYAKERRELVGTGQAQDSIKAGTPTPSNTQAQLSLVNTAKKMPSDRSKVAGTISNKSEYSKTGGETTHISVIDSNGNAVSLSTTLSHVFGSGAWVNGFILNNSAFDFSDLNSEEEWKSNHPYRIRASTISPTIILDENDEVRLVIGAPGGGRIPTAVLQNTVYILEYGLDPYDAVQMPRIFPDYYEPKVEIEKGFDPDVLKEVRQMGYGIKTLSEGYARLYLVAKQNGKLIGVADPRHDGEVRGY